MYYQLYKITITKEIRNKDKIQIHRNMYLLLTSELEAGISRNT